MSVVVATTLQRLLEAEGAIIHPALKVAAFSSMGGGLGVVTTQNLTATTTIATMPFSSMITVRKARYNLAMAEVEYLAQVRAAAASSSSSSSSHCSVTPHVVPFTSRVWSSAEAKSHLDATRLAEVNQKVSELKEKLSATDTLVCYLTLMASLYGRFDRGQGKEGNQGATRVREDSNGDTSIPLVRLRFTHENAWMRMWINTLPSQYDNLLELAASSTSSSCSSSGGGDGSLVTFNSRFTSYEATAEDFIAHALPFARHRAKVLDEQHHLVRRYEQCLDVLALLRSLPIGHDASDHGKDEGVEATEPTLPSSLPTSRSGTARKCRLGQFLWAFNTLMSRGFAFDDEVWAMMPLVDYFNYALESNGSMRPERTTISTLASRVAGRFRRSVMTANAAAAGDPNAYCYSFTLSYAVTRGEQVFLSYGSYSDFELLMWYGFTLRPFLLSTPSAAALDSALLSGLASEAGRRAIFKDIWVRTQQALRADRAALDNSHPETETNRKDEKESGEEEGKNGSQAATTMASCEEELEEEAIGNWQSDYETWCTALQRAYAHAFSSLADTDGEYAAQAVGHTWMDELVSAFTRATSPSTDNTLRPVTENEKMAQACALALAQTWPAKLSATAYRLASEGHTTCYFGIFGLSSDMREWISRLATRCDGVASFVAHAPSGMPPTHAVLRAISWMELTTCYSSSGNADGDTGDAAAVGGVTVVSAAATSMARTVSKDTRALLKYLAVDAGDEALEMYLSYDNGW